ncbi:hypothetical protein [Thiothrix fructosivorans]|uniref:Uncharacterized protein n=1 Tax=Thiothrix fructosivorans TaxID=111770 RepID=A0A8B0SH44_9GAMM|nr:hypothetical protein [Thiothrix fructosivorans]MBO0611904.1 hypothetical protein [Thiothrix fructosivorans]QTX10451.1 hypothetical protein J1836_018035 [Thiothrix fructosivorans]
MDAYGMDAYGMDAYGMDAYGMDAYGMDKGCRAEARPTGGGGMWRML